MEFNLLNESLIGLSTFGGLSHSSIQPILLRLTLLTITILLYAIFVYYSYKLFSRKNLIDFNFKFYIESTRPILSSILGFFVYLIKYLVVLPFFVIAWFTFYSLFLLILAKNLDINTILMISTALIAVIRISSFTNNTLSQDIAKMLPFTLLGLALTGEKLFSWDLIRSRLSEIPALFSSFPVYLLFIFIVEFVLRIIDAIRIFILRGNFLNNEL